MILFFVKTWEEQIAEVRRLDDGYKVLEQTLQVYAKALSDADNAVRISGKELDSAAGGK